MHIWQKLSTVEHKKMLIVRNYWRNLAYRQKLLAKPNTRSTLQKGHAGCVELPRHTYV
jgi:hypothetical protein